MNSEIDNCINQFSASIQEVLQAIRQIGEINAPESNNFNAKSAPKSVFCHEC